MSPKHRPKFSSLQTRVSCAINVISDTETVFPRIVSHPIHGGRLSRTLQLSYSKDDTPGSHSKETLSVKEKPL